MEFIEFEQYIIDKTDNFDIKVDDLWCSMISLPDIVPKSEIVNKHNDDNETELLISIKKIAVDLYKKYIEVGAEYEINIHSRLRVDCSVMKDIEQLINNNSETVETLLQKLNRCCKSQMRLMDSSYHRFIETAAFQKLKYLFFI